MYPRCVTTQGAGEKAWSSPRSTETNMKEIVVVRVHNPLLRPENSWRGKVRIPMHHQFVVAQRPDETPPTPQTALLTLGDARAESARHARLARCVSGLGARGLDFVAGHVAVCVVLVLCPPNPTRGCGGTLTAPAGGAASKLGKEHRCPPKLAQLDRIGHRRVELAAVAVEGIKQVRRRVAAEPRAGRGGKPLVPCVDGVAPAVC